MSRHQLPVVSNKGHERGELDTYDVTVWARDRAQKLSRRAVRSDVPLSEYLGENGALLVWLAVEEKFDVDLRFIPRCIADLHWSVPTYVRERSNIPRVKTTTPSSAAPEGAED
jgi:hypothetical protein